MISDTDPESNKVFLASINSRLVDLGCGCLYPQAD